MSNSFFQPPQALIALPLKYASLFLTRSINVYWYLPFNVTRQLKSLLKKSICF